MSAITDGGYVGQRYIPGFSTVTGMNHWNGYVSAMASLESAHNIVTYASKLINGKATKKMVRDLNDVGIDENIAKRIVEQTDKYGEVAEGGLRLPRSEAWDDQLAERALRIAALNGVHQTVLRVGVGETPRFFSDPVWGLMGQFRAFAYSSTQSILLTKLSQRDMSAMGGMMSSVFFGGLATLLKDLSKNAANPDEIFERYSGDKGMAKFFMEAVDRGGLPGVLSEFHNIAEKATGHGLNSLITGEPANRYQSRNLVGSMVGPTAGGLADATGFFGAVTRGDIDHSALQQGKRLVPGHTVWYMRSMLDKAQGSLEETFGVR